MKADILRENNKNLDYSVSSSAQPSRARAATTIFCKITRRRTSFSRMISMCVLLPLLFRCLTRSGWNVTNPGTKEVLANHLLVSTHRPSKQRHSA